MFNWQVAPCKSSPLNFYDAVTVQFEDSGFQNAGMRFSNGRTNGDQLTGNVLETNPI